MKIICIGRNYVAHAEELGNEVPKDPLVFFKPKTALLLDKKDFYYPQFSKDIHFEGELVYKICNNGRHIKPKFTKDYYKEVSIGIDFTARDIQQTCKEKGLPWEKAKAFDHSAVVGDFLPLESVTQADGSIQYTLEKNGTTTQNGNTNLMLHTIDDIIVHVSKFFTLNIGDLIFTGTPAGVGPIKIGDTFTGKFGDKEVMKCSIK
jgi:2-keto-4-pentenoate hydratase/2-oxohepta-3-ene-1,7-dioic acid hydratase in catechol pathway